MKKQKLHPIDPKISLDAALKFFNGVQAHLAAALDLNRATVNEWFTGGDKFVPPLHAHRLARMYPEHFGERDAA